MSSESQAAYEAELSGSASSHSMEAPEGASGGGMASVPLHPGTGGTSSHSGSGTGGTSLSSGTGAASHYYGSGYDPKYVRELVRLGAIRDKQVKLKGNGEDTVTMMIYMNGSDLESEEGEATTDIAEILAAGSSDKVNILIKTIGTKNWQNYGISSKRSQIYKVTGNGLELVKDDLKQEAVGNAETLSDFISWGARNYPADRYILQLWNHGGGPVYGFGGDETGDEEDTLTLSEMQRALKKGGVYFDFIGMDCCLMACLEVGCALYDFCDYLITSEDFESGLGWSYTGWVKALYDNTSIPTPELGRIIVDDMVRDNEDAKSSGWGDSAILSVIDVSMVKVLYTAWKQFAYANEAVLLGDNYSRELTRKSYGRLSPAAKKSLFDLIDILLSEDTQMSDYYITDIMAVADNIESDESDALKAAVSQTIVYMNATTEDMELTGISVTLPYGDGSFYSELNSEFTSAGFDSEYVGWLKRFVNASGADSYYNYDEWDESWDGWGSFVLEMLALELFNDCCSD
ncbi:MAG: clostripain-related cysteine peptidase [Eubacteriales bacterium]|nr:clostripain-related cysteine peptidase [Eubacteriales bacterium]